MIVQPEPRVECRKEKRVVGDVKGELAYREPLSIDAGDDICCFRFQSNRFRLRL